MGFLAKMLLAFIWMILLPCLLGLLPCALLPKEKRTLSVVCLSGYCLTFSLFAVVYLPILLLTEAASFQTLVAAFAAVSLAAAAGGVILAGGRGGLSFSLRRPGREEAALWAVFAALLLFQLYMAYTRASFDGDDAYYVAASVIADQQNSMYRILPYTGGATALDARHALAGFPMWIAYLARMSGAHAAIITHSILPLLLIPLTDLSFFVMAKRIFEGDGENAADGMIKVAGMDAAGGAARAAGTGLSSGAARVAASPRVLVPSFMIVVALLQIFGNVSIYTPETFLLMRTWQGKSIFANLVVPLAFVLLLWIGKVYRQEAPVRAKSRAARSGGAAERSRAVGMLRRPRALSPVQRERLFVWLFVLCLNLTAGLCTSMAVVLLTLLLGVGAFWLSVARRSWRILGWTVLVCVPNALHLALLLVLH